MIVLRVLMVLRVEHIVGGRKRERETERGERRREERERVFKNALVRGLVCDGALSSCHHQLYVSVPRRATQCGKYTSSPPSECSIRYVHTLFDETRRYKRCSHVTPARQNQKFQMPFASDRQHAHALQHVTAKSSILPIGFQTSISVHARA